MKFATRILLVQSKLPIFSLHSNARTMSLSPEKKLRIFIVIALLVGWIIVIFLRSGTSWG